MRTNPRTNHGGILSALIVIVLMAMVAAARAQTPAAQFASKPPEGALMSATVEPNPAVVGDMVRYTMSLEGNFSADQIEAPSFAITDSLELKAGPNTNSSFQYSGATSRLVTSWSYDLRAGKTGDFVIPPARLRINGKWYQTDSVKLKITEPEKGGLSKIISARTMYPELNKQLLDRYFIYAEPPAKVYQGQAVPINVYLYRDAQLPDARVRTDKTADVGGTDFIISNAVDPQGVIGQWENADFEGKSFKRAPLFTTYVSPTKTGELTLTPPSIRVYLQLQQRNPPRIEDMFDMGRNVVQVDLEMRPIIMTVLPVPPKPANAAMQIVGDVQTKVSVDRTTVPQRELLTLSMELWGNAFLEQLSPPSLPDLKGMKFYDKTTPTSNATIRDGTFLATKKFQFIYQATEPGNLEIPGVTIAVFNPETGEQRLVTTDPLKVKVEPSTSGAMLIGGSPRGETPTTDASPEHAQAKVLGSDVAYVDASPITAASLSVRKAFYVQPWFWAAQFIPLTTALGFGIVTLRRQRGGGESAATRKRRGRMGAAQALRNARATMSGSTRDEFYATLANGVLDYSALLLGRSAMGLTGEEAAQKLREQGRSPAAAARLQKLLRECDAIRYSPAPDNAATREAALREAEALLDELTAEGAAK
ncbi:hypothetical protein BH09SUM1_BH09SUM1_23820 [soil metagenome]